MESSETESAIGKKSFDGRKASREDAPPEGRTELFVEMRTIVKALEEVEQQIRNAEEEMEVAAGEAGDEVRRTAGKQERRVERHPGAQEEESPQQGGKEEDGQREVEV